MEQLQEIANQQRTSLVINLDDLHDHKSDREFVEMVIRNTKRYQDVFAKAADKAMPPSNVEQFHNASVFDVWIMMRQERVNEAKLSRPDDHATASLPAVLTRRYDVRIVPRASDKVSILRLFHPP